MPALIPFDRTHPHASLLSIAAEVAIGPEVIDLCFVLTGEIDRIVLPPPAAAPARRDELWRSTCLELFVRGEGAAYAEFNLAPSGDWAAYAFDDYRKGMRDLAGCAGAGLHATRTAQSFTANARIVCASLPGALGAGQWRAGLTAVIAGLDGETSYWALAHPPGKPDFHHEACFALDLPAPQRS